MAAIDELIDEYLGTALPASAQRDLAMMQVANASVQDDAVQKAVANAQGIEQKNRSALEEYLVAAEQQAAAESQKALEMAQQRLNAINQNITMISTTVGVGKEGKRQLQALEKEKQDILQAFPQLGKAGGAANAPEASAGFDIAKMLESKDYSPENIAKLFEANDWDVWDQALRTGDLDLYQAMLDGKLGALPEGMADKMKFVIGGMPETSKALKLDDKYARLRGVIGETQGDLKKKARDEAAAAKKKKDDDLLNEALAEYTVLKDQALDARNIWAKKKFKTKDFIEKMRVLSKNNKLSGEEKNKLRTLTGEDI